MAFLYNACAYNGGKFQSAEWDVCCPDWENSDNANPDSFKCQVFPAAVYSCVGINPQDWVCSTSDGDIINPPDPEGEWGPTPIPTPVEYEPLVTRDQSSCGN